jgi:hypothetical protein
MSIAHAIAFGATMLAALTAFRTVAPQPYEAIGLSRFTFYRFHVSTYAQFVVVPSVLFGLGCVLTGVTWPYSVTVLLGIGLAVLGMLLGPLARALIKVLPRGGAVIGVTFGALSYLLPLSSLVLPYVAKSIATP